MGGGIVLTPVMVGLFFTSMSVLEGGGLEEAKKRISTSWEPTLYKNWGLFSTFSPFFSTGVELVLMG
jgi:hypothetical protein